MIRAALLLLPLLAPAPAAADALMGPRPAAFRFGRLELSPYARAVETYHSNLFLRPDPQSTFIHALEGGAKAAFELADRHRFSLDYDLSYQAFTLNPSVNNTLNHGGELLYKYAGPRFSARARESYLNTVDAPNAEQTDRPRRWRNVAGFGLEYAPAGGPLFVSADAGQTTHKYVGGSPLLRELVNRYEQTLEGRVGYRVLPRTRAYAAYRRGIVHYTAVTQPPTKNHKSHTFALGVESEVANKLEALLEAGVNRRKYDDAAIPGADLTTRDAILTAKLGYRPLERTLLELTASRALQEAQLQGNRYYVATGGSAALLHRLPSNVTLGAYAGMERDEFSDPVTLDGRTDTRRDDVFQGRASAEWDIRDRVKLGAAYTRRERVSNFGGRFDYRANVVTASATLFF